MKKLFIILLILIAKLSFSQDNERTITNIWVYPLPSWNEVNWTVSNASNARYYLIERNGELIGARGGNGFFSTAYTFYDQFAETNSYYTIRTVYIDGNEDYSGPYYVYSKYAWWMNWWRTHF